jgi:type I restriction enzyme S subunit
MRNLHWGDVAELRYGKSIREYPSEPSDDFRFRVFGTNGPIGWHNEPLVEAPGIIIGRKGAYRGVHFSQQPFFVIDTAYYLKINDPEIDLKWAYYQLTTVDINRMDSGSAIPSTKREDFYSIPVSIPKLSTQQRIAEILTSYDALMENNRRRMELLEESARLLYREWFVRLRFPGHEHARLTSGIPSGWERVPTPEAIEINPTTRLSDEEERWYVEMANLPTDSMVIQSAIKRDGRSGSKFRNGDTLLARITPCLENGKTGFVNFMADGESGRGSTEFIVLRSKRVTPEFVYCLARTYDFRENAIKSMIGSSGRQRVQESCFEKFIVLVPPRSLLELFSESAKPMFQQIRVLHLQNQKLRVACDLLLPRLMSGEIELA